MGRLLILYASKHGQTGKIASFLGNELKNMGHTVDVLNCRHVSKYLRAENYDGVVIGAPVYSHRYPRSIQKWVRVHSHLLNKMPAAFFTVCLASLREDPNAHHEIMAIEDEFFRKTRWHPKRSTAFLGALSYSKYSWLVRRMMQAIARRAGGETDVSHDYEYTNWREVRRFAHEFVQDLGAARIQAA